MARLSQSGSHIGLIGSTLDSTAGSLQSSEGQGGVARKIQSSILNQLPVIARKEFRGFRSSPHDVSVVGRRGGSVDTFTKPDFNRVINLEGSAD